MQRIDLLYPFLFLLIQFSGSLLCKIKSSIKIQNIILKGKLNMITNVSVDYFSFIRIEMENRALRYLCLMGWTKVRMLTFVLRIEFAIGMESNPFTSEILT